MLRLECPRAQRRHTFGAAPSELGVEARVATHQRTTSPVSVHSEAPAINPRLTGIEDCESGARAQPPLTVRIASQFAGVFATREPHA